MAGNLYGGGDASGGASAALTSLAVQLSNVQGYVYQDNGRDVTGLLSLFAAGETTEDGVSASLVREAVDVRVSGMQLENLWGAVSVAEDDAPFSPTASVTVRFLEAAGLTSQLACVDRIDLATALEVPGFQPKADGVPTVVSAQEFAVGDTLVTCAAPDADAGWFALEDREIGFEQDADRARWFLTRASGSIVVQPAEGEATPEVALVDADGALASLLTEEDKAALDQGSSVVFSLSVAPYDPVLEEEVLLEEAARAGSYDFAQHLDISLSKVVDGIETPLSKLAAPLQLTISVPEEFLSDGEPLTFAVIRVHEGADGTRDATVLADRDDEPTTVTIETDAFSTYSLAYAVDDSGGAGGPDGEGGDSGGGGSNGNDGQGGSQSGDGFGGSDGKGDAGGSRGNAGGTGGSGRGANAASGSLLTTGDPMTATMLVIGGSALAAACTACAVVIRRSRRRS